MNRAFSKLKLGALLLAAACGGEGTENRTDSSLTPNSEWPSYGHDVRNTRHNAGDRAISTKNVSKLVKKWDTGSTGVTRFAVTGTPAIKEGIVYFGDWGGKLHAVNANDGSPVWGTQLSDVTSGPDAQLNASAFVTDTRVYLGGTNNRLYAVDRATGAKTWEPYSQIGNEPQVILWSSPNVVDNTLIIGVGSFQVFLPGPYTFKGNVVGVDATDGKVQWTTYLTEGNGESGFGCSVWGSAALDTERKWAFIGIGQAYSSPASKLSDSVVAIDYTTGELKWGYQFTENDIFTLTQPGDDFDVGASVIVYDTADKQLVAAGDKGGKFYALERETGTLVWQRQLTPGGRTGGVMASPALADGVIYVLSNNGIAENIGSEGPTKGSAIALNADTGDVIWEVEITPGAFGGVAIANGLMFFTTLDGVIHALDIKDGAELWNAPLMDGSVNKSAGGVSVANGMVFAGAGWVWTPIAAPPAGGVTAYALP